MCQYKFFLKSSRKLLTKTRFYYRKKQLFRGQNTPIMFVRAPKHFKSGKQHTFFFNSSVRKIFFVQNTAHFSFFISPKVVFNAMQNTTHPNPKGAVLSRVTITATVLLQY